MTIKKLQKLVENNTIMYCVINGRLFEIMNLTGTLEFFPDDDIFNPQTVELKDVEFFSDSLSEVQAFINGTLKNFKKERKIRRRENKMLHLHELYGQHTPLYIPYIELPEDEDEDDIF